MQDASDTKEALKNAAILIAELRTGLLTPKVYYELYIDVFSHLQCVTCPPTHPPTQPTPQACWHHRHAGQSSSSSSP